MSVDQFIEACEFGDLATVEDVGAIVGFNCQDGYGNTGLSVSLLAEGMAVFHFLLSRPDINVNLPGPDGYTALHIASYNDNEEAVRALVMRDDIDMTVKNSNGRTAKEDAANMKKDGLVAIMEEAEKVKKQKIEEEVAKAPTKDDVGLELARGVSSLAGTDDLVDLIIICRDGQEIKCHKVVLAALSEVRRTYHGCPCPISYF